MFEIIGKVSKNIIPNNKVELLNYTLLLSCIIFDAFTFLYFVVITSND